MARSGGGRRAPGAVPGAEGPAGDGILSETHAQADPTIAAPERPVLELSIASADLPRLLRTAALTTHRHGRCRSQRVATVWHDTAAGALQARGLAISEQAGRWRLERLRPNGVADWPPGTPAPVLAEGAGPDLLGERLTGTLVPVAAFTGVRRSYPLRFGAADARLDVLEGALRGVAHEKPACRLHFTGPHTDMAGFATALAGEVGILVPRAGLGADAVAVAQSTVPAPRQLGAPAVPPGLDVAQAMRLVAGHLADVILYWAPLAPLGQAPEPVHQMRVAVRRLRAAISLFGRVAAGPALKELGQALKDLAGRLGAARDWDVFLDESGAAVRAAFAGDARVAGLAAAATRKRAAAYAALHAYLASDAWRLLALRLALLPTIEPWLDPADPAQPGLLAAPAEDYAARTLDRVQRHVLKAGAGFETLPPSELHTIRKQAKKLRYATEFFAALFPAKRVKRFLERLQDLQADLGTVNDGHVAADLMGRLGGGADRAFAAGAVQGYVAAHGVRASQRAVKSWTKYTRQEIFWN